MSNAEPRPTIGRIVHFTGTHGKMPLPHAAIVTWVNEDGSLSLHVFQRTGQIDVHNVKASAHPPTHPGAIGCWSWPPLSRAV